MSDAWTRVRIMGQIRKASDLLAKKPEMFEAMNLKMYDAFFALDKLEEKYPLAFKEYGADELFGDWCSEMWIQFNEELKDAYLTFEGMAHFIGRTSSFRLSEKEWDFAVFDRNGALDPTASVLNFLDMQGIHLSMLGKSDVQADQEELEASDIEYILHDLCYELQVEACENVEYVYDLIDEVKRNQCDLLEAFISDREEWLRIEKEEEEKARAEEQNKHNLALNELPEEIQHIVEGLSTENLTDLAVELNKLKSKLDELKESLLALEEK